MEPFRRLTGKPIVFYRGNIDTDVILPARYLSTVSRSGLGRHAFADLREDPGNIFDAAEGAAAILIAGANFGCGSSREHAVWALADLGVRAIIAPSFADIFASNAYKNGLLPVALETHLVERLMEWDDEITIDLDNQSVSTNRGDEFFFPIETYHKHHLRDGLDEIAVTLSMLPVIETYEAIARREKPWVFK